MSSIDPSVRPSVRAMSGYVPGEQPQGGKFIKLNTNENPYPPSPQVKTSILAAIDRGLERYPDPMATAARQAISAVLGVPVDWVLCGNGSDDLLTIITRTFLGPEQTLRMPYPSYVLYRNLAEIQGARVSEIHFRPDWSLDTEAFCRPDEGLGLAVIPNPNSPSGTILDAAQLLEISSRLTCPLLIDEAYADFAQTHCVDLVRQSDRILVTRTLSKSYGLAGLRFGFAIAQPSVIQHLTKVKDSYNCDALAIAGAAAAILDQNWLRDNRRLVLATRGRMTEGLRALGFDVTESQANFVWCTHPRHSVQRLYEGLKQRQILVRYMPYAGWTAGLRISVGTEQQIDVLLRTLGELLSQSSEG